MQVRSATSAERPAVANVLDGAALAIDDDRLVTALDAGDVLVAVETPDADADTDPEPRILGALVLDDAEVVAVAVRRRRRGQGIGTALVDAAADQRDRLLAAFDPGVRPFWEALGFEIEPCGDDGRLRGVRSSIPASDDGH